MKDIYLFICVILAGMVSCGSPHTDIDDFKHVVEITDFDSIYSDRDSIFSGVTGMETQNNLLVLEHFEDTYHYSFIDKNNKKLLARWGKTGQGAGDFADFGLRFTLNDSTLNFMEWSKKRIHYISIEDILQGKKPSLDNATSYPYTVDFRPRAFCSIDENKFFTGSFKEGYFGGIDRNNELMNIEFSFPFSTEPVEGIYRGTTFQCVMKANEKQKKFVIMTLASDVFEIYQCLQDSVRKIYTSPFKHAPKIIQKGQRYGIDYENSIGGLKGVAVSDEWICFKYSPTIGDDDFNSNIILCYDWNGNKVKKCILPFPIGAFCIDDHFIYGIHDYEDYSVVYRFKLK